LRNSGGDKFFLPIVGQLKRGLKCIQFAHLVPGRNTVAKLLKLPYHVTGVLTPVAELQPRFCSASRRQFLHVVHCTVTVMATAQAAHMVAAVLSQNSLRSILGIWRML